VSNHQYANFDFISAGKRTIQLEQEAINDLLNSLDQSFDAACRLMIECKGRVIVTGMGKSGHIGTKIAATLASTGTPAFFVHPGEASHGDLGMFTEQDVVIALSNSGESAEVVTILPLLKRKNIGLISITANPNSSLAKAADVQLNIPIEREACPLNLAPTSSTTAQLVLGDALATALLEAKGFSAEDFAFSHPGGALGRRLLLKVEDLMHSGDEIPRVSPQTTIQHALLEITRKRLGMTTVVDANDQPLGIFTDGDLRRAIDQGVDLYNTPIDAVMTKQFTTVTPSMLAAEALQIMQDKKINALIALNDQSQVTGALNMHDMLKAGVI
jgi:arabinose-5-phosphate isomerase